MAEDKKIIIDEDWKSQVAAEKAALERSQDEAAEHDVGSSGAAPADFGDQRAASLPPASFEMLITMFATEAMVGLGQLPHPETGQVEPELAHAKYAIDMLEMIAEKTKGNLTPSEEMGVGQLLHQLRMVYVGTKEALSQQAAPKAKSD